MDVCLPSVIILFASQNYISQRSQPVFITLSAGSLPGPAGETVPIQFPKQKSLGSGVNESTNDILQLREI